MPSYYQLISINPENLFKNYESTDMIYNDTNLGKGKGKSKGKSKIDFKTWDEFIKYQWSWTL